MEINAGKAKVFASLDGFGTKGYSQALVLHDITLFVQRRLSLDDIPRLSDHIDLIGGSGMGGMLSLFIGRLRMRSDVALASYERFSQEVFGNSNGLTGRHKYNWVTFEKSFKTIVQEAGHNADEMMEEENPQCKTVVWAQTANTKEIQAIRSYKDRSGPNPPFSILQAARATMASPDLFPSVSVDYPLDDSEFVALFTNPAEHILEEARMVFPESTPVSCILSIGSGKGHNPTSIQGENSTELLEIYSVNGSDHEDAHERVAAQFSKLNVYYRLDSKAEAIHTQPNDMEDFGRIQNSTYAYLRENENLFSSLARKIASPTGGPPYMHTLNRPPLECPPMPSPPNLTPTFVGRSDLIEKILTYHVSPQPPSTPQHHITVLHGSSGMGKTQLSLKILQELRQRNPTILGFMIDARSTIAIEAGLRLLIHSRGRFLSHADYKDGLRWLNEIRHECVVIFQNADDPNIDISPYIPQGEGKHIIVTCRTPPSALGLHSVHHVDSLDPQESLHLLLSTAHCSDDEIEHARKIVAELDHHPLAVSLAGTFIGKLCPIQDYLKEFHQTKTKLQSMLPVTHEAKDLVLYAALQLSFKQLPSATQDILLIFSFLSGFQIEDELLIQAMSSSFSPENKLIDELPLYREEMKHRANILQEIFYSKGAWDSYEFDQRMAPAIQYSLLHTVEGPGRRKFYSMHPNIQKFLRDDKLDLKTLALQLLTSSIGITKSLQFRNPDWNKRLLPHIQSIPLVKNPPPVECFTMAKLLRENGEHQDAERFLFPSRAEGAGHNMAEVDRFHLRIQESLVSVWIEPESCKNPSDKLSADALDICQVSRGCDNPAIFMMMSALAQAFRRNGALSQAVILQAQVVESIKRLLGDDDLHTIRATQALALMANFQENYARAVELQKPVVKTLERVYGAEHAYTLLATSELAQFHLNKEEYRTAAQLGDGILGAIKRELGETDLETMTSMKTLVIAFHHLGEYAKAVEVSGQLIKASEKAYGMYDSNTLDAKSRLARIFSKQRDLVQAIRVHEEVLKKQMQLHGEKDPRTLTTMIFLAMDLSLKHEHVRAEEMQRRALEIETERRGEDDRSTLQLMSNLTSIMIRAKKYSQAAEVTERQLKIRRKTLGEKHPDTIQSETKLTDILARMRHIQPSATSTSTSATPSGMGNSNNPFWNTMTDRFKNAFNI